MYIYCGKVNWISNASNETITVVLPAGFSLNDPVCAYWQWTQSAKGVEKENVTEFGGITSVTRTKAYKVTFTLSYYGFDVDVSSDFKTLSATMWDVEGYRSDGPITLSLQQGDMTGVPFAAVFTGKLDYLEYASNEMITLVIPYEISNGAPVGLYYQWTKDGSGNPKAEHLLNTTFREVTISQDGEATATFDDGYYTFQANVLSDKQQATVQLSGPDGKYSTSDLKQTDFRNSGKKKALIFRYGTRTDEGIFLVRDMLTKYLGFGLGDIEMCYYDVEPDSGPKQRNDGQAAPTATNFKDKFTSLLSGAVLGDVRFLYVDTHGTIYPDSGTEPDGMDEGWTFAENDDGTTKEVVYDDWVAQTIRDNLKPGVNLTILTSSCMGGGMLDTHSGTPGVLLAGCHETQFNVKSLRLGSGDVVDPWMYAITSVIKSRMKRKREVPSYAFLFNEAKKVIVKQLQGGQLTKSYKGPSPDETNPLPRDESLNSSNQDPQLVFCKGYINPDTDRFLYPFATAEAGESGGKDTRYPNDEL